MAVTAQRLQKRLEAILALYDHALSPTKVVDALYFAAWLRDQRRYTPKDIYPLIVALNGGMHFSPARGELPCQVYWGNPVPKMDDRYSANTLRTLDPELKSYEWPYDEVPFIEIAFQNDTPTGGNRFYYDKADGPSLTSIMADYANQNPLARNLKGEGMFRKEDFLMQLWKPYIRLAGKHPAINLGLCRLGPNDHSDAPIPYWPPDRYWQPEAYADDGPPPKVNPWRNYYNLIPVEAPQASQVPADFENFSAYKINPNPFDFL